MNKLFIKVYAGFLNFYALLNLRFFIFVVPDGLSIPKK